MSRACCLISLSVVLAACGGPPPASPAIAYSPCAPVLLAPEAGTTAEELESIEAAIAMWREVGLTTLTLSPSDAAGALPLRFEHAAAVFHGVYEPGSGRVFINRGLAGFEREVTVAHEVGHALGLPHVARALRPSLMNPGNLTERPSLEDEGELQSLWSCPRAP